MQKYIDAAFSSRPVMPLSGAKVTVTTANGDLATLYSDNAGTTMGNPIYTDSAGNYSFYAADGRYTITISKTGFQTQTITDVLLEDPSDQVADLNALQLADYAALRAYAGPRKSVYVTGVLGTAAPSGIAGMFVLDATDTTTADNGGTVIVTSGGKRYKRAYDGAVLHAAWFGYGLSAAIGAMFSGCTLDLDGKRDYTGSGFAITTPNCRIINGKVTAPATATETIFRVQANNVWLQVETYVDWAALTGANGTVNVGGVSFESVNGGGLLPGAIIDGGRCDMYSANDILHGCPVTISHSISVKLLPGVQVKNAGYCDAVHINRSYRCEDFSTVAGAQYSGKATYTPSATSASGSYGEHIIGGIVSDCGTSSITINDPKCIVQHPVVDGGQNSVNFGHSGTACADGSILIGGVLSNPTQNNVRVGGSKNIQIIKPSCFNAGQDAIKFFDDCQRGYVSAIVRNAGASAFAFSIGAYEFDGVVADSDVEMVGDHMFTAIGGTAYTVRGITVRDVDNNNANRNLVDWTCNTVVLPRKLSVIGVAYEHKNSASAANRGINITNSTATLAVDAKDNDFKDVAFEKFNFSPSAPKTDIDGNRLSSDAKFIGVTILAASTSLVVNNGNITPFSNPIIVPKSTTAATRGIYVSSIGNGTLTLTCATAASDSVLALDL